MYYLFMIMFFCFFRKNKYITCIFNINNFFIFDNIIIFFTIFDDVYFKIRIINIIF